MSVSALIHIRAVSLKNFLSNGNSNILFSVRLINHRTMEPSSSELCCNNRRASRGLVAVEHRIGNEAFHAGEIKLNSGWRNRLRKRIFSRVFVSIWHIRRLFNGCQKKSMQKIIIVKAFEEICRSFRKNLSNLLKSLIKASQKLLRIKITSKK